MTQPVIHTEEPSKWPASTEAAMLGHLWECLKEVGATVRILPSGRCPFLEAPRHAIPDKTHQLFVDCKQAIMRDFQKACPENRRTRVWMFSGSFDFGSNATPGAAKLPTYNTQLFPDNKDATPDILGSTGQMMSCALEHLLVDHTYQRSEAGPSNTRRIAQDFKWNRFAVVSVSRRDDGSLWILNGQQRCCAARKRGGITHVPCIVYDTHGSIAEAQKQEADAYLFLNTNVRRVTATSKFYAAVIAGRQPEVDIADFLGNFGMDVGDDSNDPNNLDFPATLLRWWKHDTSAAKSAMSTYRDMCVLENKATMHADIFQGLWWVCHSGHNMAESFMILERASKTPTKKELLRSISTTAQLLEIGRNARVCGIGVIKAFNSRLPKRHRIPMPMSAVDVE